MSIQIAKVDGIPIRLHFTLVIAFFLISWSVATFSMPAYLPGLTPSAYWVIGGISAILLFASVLVHELAHAKLAIRYNVKVNQIVLFLFGGVSDIASELKDFRKDAKMAIAGPLTSLAISGLLALALFALIPFVSDSALELKIIQGILYYGALINLMLGLFNLIPAFPSDGGRLLRAMLVRKKKDYNEATKTAARVGIAISYCFIGLGFVTMFAGSFVSGVWVLLIGWFLMTGAQSYLSQLQLSSVLSGLRLKDIMNTNVIAVKANFPAGQLLEHYFQPYARGAFPVVDENNVPVGMVTLKKLLQFGQSELVKLTASDVAIPSDKIPVMDPDATAEAAAMQMTRDRVGKVFVCDKHGRLVGLVSKTEILNVEMERQEITQTLKSYKP